MNTLIGFLNGAGAAWWPWTLMSTIQGLLVLGIVAAVLLICRRVSPAWRYALLLVALVKFALPPVGPSFGLFHWLRMPGVSPPTPVDGHGPAAITDPWRADPIASQKSQAEASATGFAAATPPARTDERPAAAAVSPPEAVLPAEYVLASLQKSTGILVSDPRVSLTPAGWALAVQILVSLGMVILVIGQGVRLRGKVGRAVQVSDGGMFEIAVDAGCRVGLRRLPAMYVDGDLRSPQTGGVLRPFVLLPRWIEEAGEEEQAALVSHELAHVARRDAWVNWFQIAVQAWLWWNPFVWWLNRRIRMEREICCDDLVLGLGIAGGEAYSRTLLTVAERLTRRPATIQVVGMADTFASLKSRVARVLDNRIRRPVRLSVFSVSVLAAFAILVLPGSSPGRQEIVESQAGMLHEAVGDPTADESDAGDFPPPPDVAQAISPEDAAAMKPPRPATFLKRKITLIKPYPAFYDGSPTDRISVQYAVIAVLQQVGLGYDWDASFQNTNPICQQWIHPDIREITCGDALRMMLEPVGLQYEIADGRLLLKKLETGDDTKPTGPGAAPSPGSGKVTPAPGQEAVPEAAECLGYVDDSAEGKKSLGASGHAVEFARPQNARYVEAVQIAAERYGTPKPPAVDFHLCVLDGERRVLANVPFPYAFIERGDLRWYTLRTPSIEVPEQFFIALDFNPHQTKGIYLGLDESVSEFHSYIGLPDSGFEKVEEEYGWMIRACLSEEPTGEKGTMRLADWSLPEPVDPFEGCIEVIYDDGESDGKQSYGGFGPAIRFLPTAFIPKSVAGKDIRLAGFRLYASRYGSGYEPDETMLDAALVDPAGKVRWSGTFPYSLFSYSEQWVDLVLDEPVPVDFADQTEGDWILSLNPHAHRYQGIYFHYDTDVEESHSVKELSHSLSGTVDGGFQTVTDREWMIHAYLIVQDES